MPSRLAPILSRRSSGLSENAKPGDTVFVFYSGHGTETRRQDRTCFPYDFPRAATSFRRNRDRALEVNQVQRATQARSKPKHSMMAWDMCRNDPFAKGKRRNHAKRNPISEPQSPGESGPGAGATSRGAPIRPRNQVNLLRLFDRRDIVRVDGQEPGLLRLLPRKRNPWRGCRRAGQRDARRPGKVRSEKCPGYDEDQRGAGADALPRVRRRERGRLRAGHRQGSQQRTSRR